MNFFFFLDHTDNELCSQCDIFNYPAARHLSVYDSIDRLLIAYYSDGIRWHSKIITKIAKEESLSLNKNELPYNFQDKSVIFSLYPETDFNLQYPYIQKKVKSIPSLRCNIKIMSTNTSTSYQGDIPPNFLTKNLSLVSCSPMLQFEENIDNYLYLINFTADPIKKNFTLTSKNQFHSSVSFNFKTNTINIINLSDLIKDSKSNFLITTSRDHGGIPIYLSKTKDNTSMSLEHTHPPTEYLFLGNRFYFQKLKKNFYLK